MPSGQCSCHWDHLPFDPSVQTVDLGDDHLAHLYSFFGDAEPAGLILWHKKADGFWCHGGAAWKRHPSETFQSALWTLYSLDPLHLEPSLLCHCGDHGFIRDGKWEVA